MGAAGLWIGAIAGVVLAVRQVVAIREGDGGIALLVLWVALVAGAVWGALSRVHPRMRELKGGIGDLETRCQGKRDEG